MKMLGKLLLTAFLSGAGAATLDTIMSGESIATNPRHSASIIVAGGLIGVANHLREAPKKKK